MFKLLLFIFLLSLSSCMNSYKSSKHIAVIRGESLNLRIPLDEPAPYESRIAFECLELEAKPIIKFYSRNRAIELFETGMVDVVVSGQASVFPENVISYRKIKEGTKAVILYKSNSEQLGIVGDLPKGSKVGLLDNSAFSSDFVSRAGDIKVNIYRSSSVAVQALKAGKIDCLVIDKVAVDHISLLIPGAKSRVLDLPSKAISWLYR